MVVDYKVGFAGRATLWEALNSMVFRNHVGLRYLDNPTECLRVDVALVEAYLLNLARHCVNAKTINQGVIEIAVGILSGLQVGTVLMGVDLGKVRNGVAVLAEDTPLLHMTLGQAALVKLINELARYMRIKLVVGNSPGVKALVSSLMVGVGGRDIVVKVIDERSISHRRPWFKKMYPDLTKDELDGLMYAYSEAEEGIEMTLTK